jgi:hypothetical protein
MMAYDYEGFEEYFFRKCGILKKRLNAHYEKISGKTFNLRTNKLLEEVKNGDFEIHIGENEKAAALGLWLMSSLTKKSKMLTFFQNYELAIEINKFIESDIDISSFNSRIKKHAANSKWDKDPKMVDKKFVKECWDRWQKNPHEYKSKAAFARAMLDKCEHLTSNKVIEDWTRKWSKL